MTGVNLSLRDNRVLITIPQEVDLRSLAPTPSQTYAALDGDQILELMLDLLEGRGKILPADPSGDDMRQLVAGLRSFVLYVADRLADEDPATASVIRQLKHDLGQALSIRAKVIDYKARPIA